MICKQIQSLTLCCSSMQDHSTLIIPVWKEGDSNSATHVVNNFIEWSIDNGMKCNFSKCKEMVFGKKGYNNVLETVQNIPQHPELCILGVTFYENCRFSIHVKNKLAALINVYTF